MSKYEIEKPIIENIKGVFKETGIETKIIYKESLNSYINNRWKVKRKVYPAWTYLSDSWRSLNTNQKISIIGIIVAAIVAIIVDNTGC